MIQNEYLQAEIAKLEVWLLEENIRFSKESFKAEDGKIHRLYVTTNQINQKFYVGLHSHKRLDKRYIGCGISSNLTFDNPGIYIQRALKRSPFWRAFKKYGKQAFYKIDFIYFYSREDLIRAEKQFITKEMVFREDCYNGTIGGSLPPYNVGEANGNYGNKWTDEQKQKASIMLRGKKHNTKWTDEQKKEQSDRLKGKNDQIRANNSRAKPCLAIDCSTGEAIHFGCGKDMADFLGFSYFSVSTWLVSNQKLSGGLRKSKYVCFLKKEYEEFSLEQIKEIIVNTILQSRLFYVTANQYIDVINQKY